MAAPTDSLTSCRRLLVVLLVAAGILLAGCGSGDNETAEPPDPGVGTEAGRDNAVADDRPEANLATGDEIVAAVLDRFPGLLDDEGNPATAADLQELLSTLAPAGVEIDDPRFAASLAARLGPEYADITDVDVLIDALLEMIDPGGEITTVAGLLDAVTAWATQGVVRLGSEGDAASTITASTSFEEAELILSAGGAWIDLIPGISAMELRGIELAADPETRTISLMGHTPAPIDGRASLELRWAGSTPEFKVQIRRDQITLAGIAGSERLAAIGSVGVDDVSIDIRAAGISVTATLDPSGVAGVGGLDLPSGPVPVTFAIPGLGTFGTSPAAVEFDVEVPFESLATVADWNTARRATLTIHIATEPSLGYAETWTAQLGSESVTFAGAATVTSAGDAELELAMTGDWDRPFGVDWLTLRTVELDISTGGTAGSASILGQFTIGGKNGSLELRISDDGSSASVTGTLADLTIDDLATVARTVAGSGLVPDSIQLPDDVFTLRDVEVSFTTGRGGSAFSIGASTEFLGRRADALLAVVPAKGGGRATVLAVTPRDLALGDLLPVLADDPTVGGIRIPETALILTSKEVDATASALPAGARRMLGGAFGGDDFRLRLGGGLSLAGSIPGGISPGIDDLKESLGMDRGAAVLLSGTLPIGVLTGGATTNFELNAVLPEMKPAGGAAWFVSAQLGIRITGQPSVGVVGRLTMDLAGDIQTFEVEASIGRSQAGGGFELIGRLDGAWESPFGVEWLTLNEVVLKLGLAPTGSVTIGFLADMQIGTKDIRGAMVVSVHTVTGAPMNFGFEAASDAGVSLGDVADLYTQMSGEPRPPIEQVMPAVELRRLAIRFAPRGDADLGIEQGFRLAGELWMGTSAGAPLELVVGVDAEISDEGVAIDGFLTDWALGPIAFDQATLSLRLTAAEQRFAVSGGIDVNGQAVSVDLILSRDELAFGTRVVVAGGEARLEVAAGFNVLDPSFRVTAFMDAQFLANLDAALERLLGRQVTDINRQVRDGQRDLATAERALKVAEDALAAAQKAVRITGCGWPFGYLCDAVDSARAEVRRLRTSVNSARNELARAEALLDRYDIQLTLVGAQFTAQWDNFEAGKVDMVLQIDANGRRVPISIKWDFAKSMDDNLSGVLDSLIP